MSQATRGDPRPYCTPCQLRMTCVRNGYRLDLGGGVVQYGDLFECSRCHARVVAGFGEPHEEIEHKPLRRTGIGRKRDDNRLSPAAHKASDGRITDGGDAA